MKANERCSLVDISTELRPSAALLARPTFRGCGHEIVIRKNMSYGEHVFWSAGFSR